MSLVVVSVAPVMTKIYFPGILIYSILVFNGAHEEKQLQNITEPSQYFQLG